VLPLHEGEKLQANGILLCTDRAPCNRRNPELAVAPGLK
jgi:hypothetical protein